MSNISTVFAEMTQTSAQNIRPEVETGGRMVNPTKKKSQSHIPALDGLRGIAILVVMLHHFMPNLPDAPAWQQRFFKVMHTGWAGVDLFFVLSGFLITGILYDAKQSEGYFKNFYMRRILRICPVYYGLLAFLFLVLPALANTEWTSKLLHLKPSSLGAFLGDLPALQVWLWLYLVNFKLAFGSTLSSSFGFLTHFWSLAVEEHFYLIWPLLVFNLQRRALIKLCLGCVVVAFAIRAACVFGGFSFVAAYMLTPCRMDSLAVGGLAALLIRAPGGLLSILPKARLVFWTTLPLVIALFVYSNRDDRLMTIPGFSLLALFFASTLLVAVGSKRGSAINIVTSNSLLRMFGKFSYALYAYHLIVRSILATHVSIHTFSGIVNSGFVGVLLYCGSGIAASLLLAVLSWHLMEKHFIGLKRFYPNFKPTAAASTERTERACYEPAG